MLTKKCKLCGIDKPVEEYLVQNRNSKTMAKWKSRCKKCYDIWYAEQYYNKRRGRFSKYEIQKQESITYIHPVHNTYIPYWMDESVTFASGEGHINIKFAK